jgi:hypothetical protein
MIAQHTENCKSVEQILQFVEEALALLILLAGGLLNYTKNGGQ